MITVLQGGECDSFYVVGSGEFEVLATQVRVFFCLILLKCNQTDSAWFTIVSGQILKSSDSLLS